MNRKLCAAVAAITGLVLAGSACGAARAVHVSSGQLRHARPAALVSATDTVPGVTISIGTPPTGWEGVDPTSNWVYTTTATDGTPFGNALAEWKASLAAGAYSEANAGVTGWSYTFVDATGAKTFGGSGALMYKPSVAPDSSDAATIQKDIEQRSTANGVPVSAVTFLHARLNDPIITITPSSATAFLSSPPALENIVGSVDRFEGFATEVVNASGDVVGFDGFVPATGTTVRWNSPSVGGGSIVMPHP